MGGCSDVQVRSYILLRVYVCRLVCGCCLSGISLLSLFLYSARGLETRIINTISIIISCECCQTNVGRKTTETTEVVTETV